MTTHFTKAQLVNAAAILGNWALKSPLKTTDRASKVHEVYILIRLGREISNRISALGLPAANVELLTKDGLAQTIFVPRGNPNSLGCGPSKTHVALPTFIRLRYFDVDQQPRTLELHHSVQWLDALDVAHEADIAVVPTELALSELASVVPIRKDVAITIECKLWKGAATLGIAREAESFKYWMPTSSHYVAHSGPFSRSAHKFINGAAHKLNTRLFYSDGVGDPLAPHTQQFFDLVLHNSGHLLGLP